MCVKCGKLVHCKYKKTSTPKTPKNLYLVIQQGGSSKELYVHPHNTIKEARADMKSCGKASYNTVGPIEVPQALTKILLKDKDAEGDLWTLLETTLRATCEL